MLVGIYHHPPPSDMPWFIGVPVADTYTNEAFAFVSSYAAKSALWLIRFP